MEITGTRLARAYYDDVVRPALEARWPGLPHAAGRLGSGSDVLGYDDATSRDHDWGLRLTLLVPAGLVDAADAHLAAVLPDAYRGHPVRFGTTWQPEPRHQVEIATASAFAASRLGVELLVHDGVARPLEPSQWLALTGQSVLELVAGPVFADTAGELTAIRERLAWYPDDVWRYVVATDWVRLGQELPFVGRAGERGDDLGSRVVAARLAGVAMHLALLLARRWPPYPKWLGTAFAELPDAAGVGVGAARVGAGLADALAAASWPAREAGLAAACDGLAAMQTAAGLPVPDGDATLRFFDRPFRAVAPTPELLLGQVADRRVRDLPHGVGSVEQWVEGVDVLMVPSRRVAAATAVANVSAARRARRPTPSRRTGRSPDR